MTSKSIIDSEILDNIIHEIKQLKNLNSTQINGSISDINKFKLTIVKLEKILTKWPNILNNVLINKERNVICQYFDMIRESKESDAIVNIGRVMDNIIFFLYDNIATHKHPLTAGVRDELNTIVTLCLRGIFHFESDKAGHNLNMQTSMISHDKTKKYIIYTVVSGNYDFDNDKCDVVYRTGIVEKDVIHDIENNCILSKIFLNIGDAIKLHMKEYDKYYKSSDYEMATNWTYDNTELMVDGKIYKNL